MKLKHACSDSGQYGLNVSPDSYRDHGVRMLRTSDLALGAIPEDGGVFLDPGVDERFLLKANDLLLSRAGTIGRAFLAPVNAEGMAFAGFLIRFRPLPETDPRFLFYVTQSAIFQQSVVAEAVTSTISNFNADRYAQLDVPEHPVDVQRQIADFLDDRVSRIDNIIAARRKQLTAASKQLAATLAQTLSTGERVDGPLRRFVRLQDNLRMPLSVDERSLRRGPFPYYGASGVIDHIDDFVLDEPRVLVSEDGANLNLRSSPIAFVATGEYWVNNHAHIVEPNDGLHEYWAALIESQTVAGWVSGSAQPKLTADALLQLRVSPLARVEERRAVERSLLGVYAEHHEFQRHCEVSIRLLTEYKQSLITAAVTGELDVTTASTVVPA